MNLQLIFAVEILACTLNIRDDVFKYLQYFFFLFFYYSDAFFPQVLLPPRRKLLNGFCCFYFVVHQSISFFFFLFFLNCVNFGWHFNRANFQFSCKPIKLVDACKQWKNSANLTEMRFWEFPGWLAFFVQLLNCTAKTALFDLKIPPIRCDFHDPFVPKSIIFVISSNIFETRILHLIRKPARFETKKLRNRIIEKFRIYQRRWNILRNVCTTFRFVPVNYD